LDRKEAISNQGPIIWWTTKLFW